MKASIILAGLFAAVSVSALPQRPGDDCDKVELDCWKKCIVEGRLELHGAKACQAKHMDKCEKDCGGKMETYVSLLCGDHIKPVGPSRGDYYSYDEHHHSSNKNVNSQH